MCLTACPVQINTGDLVRRLRADQHGRLEQRVWTTAARHWDGVTRAAAAGLTAAHALPDRVPTALTRAGRALLGDETVPAWSPDLPAGGTRRLPRPAPTAEAVYFPSCISTMFGPTHDGAGVRAAFLALCERAGVQVRVPDEIATLCCGTPWKSKGLTDGHAAMREQVVPVLQRATDDGALPVVVDATSCTEGLAGLLADHGIRVVDAVAFVDAVVLPRLPTPRRLRSIVVHRTCSSTQLGLDPALLRIAAAAADEVIQPDDWSCCAFAGDRGLLHPELTAAATAGEAQAVRALHRTVHVSVNRTCELGMTRATGQPYRHVLEAFEAVTRPTPAHPQAVMAPFRP